MKVKYLSILIGIFCAGLAHGETIFVDANNPKYKQCQKELTKQKIEITTSAEPYVIDHTKTIAELSERLHADTQRGKGSEYSASGTNLKTFRTEVAIGGESMTLPNKEICAKVSLKAKMIIKNPIISIAKEYPQGSCMYARTLEHEEMHYKDNLKAMEETKVALASYFEKNYADKILVADEKPNNGPLAQALVEYSSDTYLKIANQKADLIDGGTHRHDRSVDACGK